MHIKSVLAIMTTAVLLCGCGSKEQPRSVQSARVATETVAMTTDYDTPTYVGQVEAQSSTVVSFSSMGSLLSVNVSEGQSVAKGQLLATIDPTSAESALAAAKAQLNQARDAEARLRQVHDAGSLPEVKWVEITSQVQQAESQVAMMEKQVKDCRVVAPVSGVIGRGICNVGETALPGQPLMTILDISRVRVSVSIPEKEYGRVSRAGSASVKVAALEGATFESHSLTRGIEGDAMTHTYNLWVNVQNPGQRLLPGMVAEVSFGSQQAEPAITLPVRSVQHGAKGHFVWTMKDGKAVVRPVSVGRTCGNRIVVSDGLTEGDVVITEGYQRLSEGSTVTTGK